MKRFLIILFLLMSLASAGLYQLPDTYVNGSLNVKNATALNVTNATTLTVEHLNSTDDVNVTDTLYVADIIQSNDAGFTNLDISGTFDVNSATMTARNITLDANKNLVLSGTGSATAPTFIGNLKIPDFFSIGAGRVVDSNYTYPAGGKMDSIVMVDCRSYNSTITLLPAAQTQGNLTIVKLQYLPGNYYTRINVTGDEHINGYDLLKTTDDAGTFTPAVTLWSSGSSWEVVNVVGTWTSTNV